MSERAFLDLLRPPEHRWFARGLWVTHDLNTASLVELVLPALAGLDVSEHEVRRAAWHGLKTYNSLTVACAADRASYRAPVPADVVEILPVAGRRLHAKYLILQYDAPDGLGLARTLTRVIVTSANLTRAGLTTNREIWACHEVTTKHGGRPSVAIDLLDATQALARELPTDQRLSLLARIGDIRRHLPRGLVRAKAIRHSLTGKTQGRLLSDVPRPTRLCIVTPPFAMGSARQALAALSPLLHRKLKLDIYVGTMLSTAMLRAGAGVPFLPSLAEALARRCEFRLYAVPGLVSKEGDEVRRMLHAKLLLAFFEGGPPRMWVGSANLTGRGLGGRNRELLLEVDPGGGKKAREFLDALPAIRLDLDRLVMPPVEDELSVEVPADPRLRCVFHPDPGTHAGQTFVAGTLLLEGDRDRVRRLRMRSEELRVVPEQRVRLAMDAPWVRALLVGSSKEVELLVSIEAEDDSFWAPTRVDAGDDGGLPRGLRLLLSDLGRARTKGPGGAEPQGGGDPGRFDLPYDRRLPNIVRMLPGLTTFDDADLECRFAEYLDDPVEREIAMDLLAALRGSTTAKDPAVRALQQLMTDG
jgi:hypothetical protein